MASTDLPAGDVTIRVAYSSVNFKDALALTARSGVVRDYPIVPGIDLAGEVVESQSQEFAPGDQVLAHGYDIGTARHGGYAEFARVPADQVVRLGTLSAHDAMAIGTAGFTAAMRVEALVSRGIRPDDGPILVTGAKPRPLGRTKWAGAVDCVGGATLADVLSTISYGGAVAASGLTGGPALNTTVMPFILRGVALLGIDSVQLPIGPRRELWARLGETLRGGHAPRGRQGRDVGDRPGAGGRRLLTLRANENGADVRHPEVPRIGAVRRTY